ncbi:hypothetical protein AB0D45_00485 [Streptomyces sp. NPDC048352]|uniref:hypothetical protein n=1 Tax=Streptomyces sp. NPDC048352 TaxID=3154718 RepID=UPI00342C7EE6
MPGTPPPCEHAKAGLKKAKEVTAAELKDLNDAQHKLIELQAVQPPNEAAIEAQEAKVDTARNNWLKARKTEKEWQVAVEELCNP